ncbi:endonuclease/exonuclease/phosphatase family protein [uncultured Draconibacterium sp.]|uniref:endonuclease/exonuclease/phosphatase family protein n=1 Tax=uncultured Draconibacterium sp. TaxID=1573823 RepID=UPI003216DE0A
MKTSFSFIILLFLFLNTRAQKNDLEYSVLFYNVENLFDVENDSLTNDDEFTFEGERHWNYKKLSNKLQNTAKAIVGSSGWELPVLIGLCEIENRYVLEKLVNETSLTPADYKIIHKESPDSRGIDVALLYQSDLFYPLKYEYYPFVQNNNKILNTREILYVEGVVDGIDTLHVFVNHWPSRYSGVMETRDLRNEAAQLLRSKIDLLLNENINSKVIILGDFNDQPNDESIRKYLNSEFLDNKVLNTQLYNLSGEWIGNNTGTLKYQSQWFIFDQIIVSGALLTSATGLYTETSWAEICNLPFLLETDASNGGLKPKRTYNGYKYNGGFSDHLPVKLKLKVH